MVEHGPRGSSFDANAQWRLSPCDRRLDPPGTGARGLGIEEEAGRAARDALQAEGEQQMRQDRKFPPGSAAAKRRGRAFGAALCALVITSAPAVGNEGAVDVALVLAVDVSLSMSPTELEIQRTGYAAAFRHQQVIDAIAAGAHGRIAVTYFEWAGEEMQRVVVPWTLVASRSDAEALADQLTANPPISARRTSISGALAFAADLLAESGVDTVRRVIDISGDGPNNNGLPVSSARDTVVAQGITVNGLPLMTSGGEGFASFYDIDHLDRYYADCVTGGPGSFVMPVNDWSQFGEAVRRKLVMELAATARIPSGRHEASLPQAIRVRADAATDCMIGEKKWNSRSWIDAN